MTLRYFKAQNTGFFSVAIEKEPDLSNLFYSLYNFYRRQNHAGTYSKNGNSFSFQTNGQTGVDLTGNATFTFIRINYKLSMASVYTSVFIVIAKG